ncbi:MAG: pyridoxal-dependent decarboxylase [Pseudomonadota bacterium]
MNADLEALLALERFAETRLAELEGTAVHAPGAVDDVRPYLRRRYTFAHAVPSEVLVEDIWRLMAGDLDSTHPRYFGLFNPPTLPITVVADAVVAILNPQVGTQTHTPVANAIEEHVLDALGERIGYTRGEFGAHFTTGGQESNATALASALTAKFPEVIREGVRALPGAPRIYVSEHAHHSFVKAAKFLGLGSRAVREIPADVSERMDPDALEAAVLSDQDGGHCPLMVVATAGTTGSGVIDRIPPLRDIAARHCLWFHVDAAWGGSVLLSERFRGCMDGIADADSVTWDAHKWLDVPMGAGMVFYRPPNATAAMFGVTTGYVPQASAVEPYLTTAQWSRRFIGLKVFMALSQLGFADYAKLIEHQIALGDYLRSLLRDSEWHITNHTPLPVVCAAAPPDYSSVSIEQLVRNINESGEAWLSALTQPGGEQVVRICITSYRAQTADIDRLVMAMNKACRTLNAAG